MPRLPVVAGPPPQRLVRQLWRSPLGLDAARTALAAVAPGPRDSEPFSFGAAGTYAQVGLTAEGAGTRVAATLGCSLGFAVLQWVICCYALFFFGMTLAARMDQPFAPALLPLLLTPLAAIAGCYALALVAQRRLRVRVERVLIERLQAERR